MITAVYALLPLLVAVPLGRRTDHGRCAPLLVVGVALISGGCALSGLAGALPVMAAWSGVRGLGHLCFVIGAQSIVARRSAPEDRDRNFGHFTIGASLGQLIGPVAAGLVISEHDGRMAPTSATALLVSGAAVSYVSLRRLEQRAGAAPPDATDRTAGRPVAVRAILRTRGVPAGIFMSLAVLSATDILTACLPVIGEDRAIAPTTIGLLLSLRAAATITCRLVMTPMIRWLGRTALMAGSCTLAGVLCGGLVLPVPVPVWALAAMLLAFGFCLGVGQPLSMTTVVQAAPERARSTALALRLTGNRLGQVAAPAGAGIWPASRAPPRPSPCSGCCCWPRARWRPVRGRRGAARMCRHGACGADGRRGPWQGGMPQRERRKVHAVRQSVRAVAPPRLVATVTPACGGIPGGAKLPALV